MSQENDGFEFHRSLGQRFIGAIYRVVNFFVPWHKLPTVLGGSTLKFSAKFSASGTFITRAMGFRPHRHGRKGMIGGVLPTDPTTAWTIRAWAWWEPGLDETYR